MCLFKKIKKNDEVIKSKFHLGEAVSFRHRDELYFGWIYAIHPHKNEETIYDVQVGGQCPAVMKGIKESELKIRK